MIRHRVLPIVAALLGACSGGGDPSGPEPLVRLRVVVRTTGQDQDVAYIMRLDDQPPRLVGANETLEIFGLSVGAHTLSFAGVAPNCTEPGGVRTITQVQGTTEVAVDVSCVATLREILFTSTRTGGYDLFVANADGSNVRQLTAGPTLWLHGVWSPDGQRIALHRGVTLKVFTMRRDGAELTEVPGTDGCGYPDWSPDGTQLAMLCEEMGGALVVMAPDGGNRRRLVVTGVAPIGGEFKPAWSPDGGSVAYYQGAEIRAVNVSTGQAVLLAQLAGSAPLHPSWSPDGRRIAFVATDQTTHSRQVHIMNLATRAITRLAVLSDEWQHEDVVWSPDGIHLAARAFGNADPEIYVFRSDGTFPLNVSRDSWEDFAPAWSP